MVGSGLSPLLQCGMQQERMRAYAPRLCCHIGWHTIVNVLSLCYFWRACLVCREVAQLYQVTWDEYMSAREFKAIG